MRLIAGLVRCLAPVSTHAAGGDDPEPPKPTLDCPACTDGQIRDADAKRCVAPDDQALNDARRYGAVPALASAGHPDDAMCVLNAITDGETDRVLTCGGGLNGPTGNFQAALAACDQALTQMNGPQRISAPLDEIRARDGRCTWAQAALADAIRTGMTTTY